MGQIVRSQMADAGKYSLLAENKNGSDRVDLDLIVIDEVPVCDCDMFLNGNLECVCHIRFRTETSDLEMARMAPSIDTNNDKKFTPKMIPINSDIPLYGVVGGWRLASDPTVTSTF